MKLRLLSAALAAASLSGIASAQFQTTVNSAKVTTRVFNDFPNSVLTTVSNFPSLISFNDVLTPNAGGGGFANRHQWQYSANGGAAAYALTGPNDFFDAAFDITLASVGTSRKEAGFLLTTNDTGAGGTAPHLDTQYIVNSDAGEIVAFGDPFAFTSLGNNASGNGYTAGTTIRMGLRYFRDVDNLYKVTFSATGHASQTKTLTNFGGMYDFGALGLPAGTTLGGYAQFTGSGQTGSASFANITPAAPVPEPATLAVLGIGAAALIRRRRAR